MNNSNSIIIIYILIVYLRSLQFAQQSAVNPSSLTSGGSSSSGGSNNSTNNAWKVCGDEDIITYINSLLLPSSTFLFSETPTVSSSTAAKTPGAIAIIKSSEISNKQSIISQAKKHASLKMQVDTISMTEQSQNQSRQWAHGMKVFDPLIYKVRVYIFVCNFNFRYCIISEVKCIICVFEDQISTYFNLLLLLLLLIIVYYIGCVKVAFYLIGAIHFAYAIIKAALLSQRRCHSKRR